MKTKASYALGLGMILILFLSACGSISPNDPFGALASSEEPVVLPQAIFQTETVNWRIQFAAEEQRQYVNEIASVEGDQLSIKDQEVAVTFGLAEDGFLKQLSGPACEKGERSFTCQINGESLMISGFSHTAQGTGDFPVK